MSRILIVDDERSIRRTLGEFLRAEGYDVVEAEDADVALRRLSEAAFDVVVTDIILPRVTGVELLRSIHATDPHVQVVMMTGEPTVETASESLRAGAADYLFKPISKAAILRVVAAASKLKGLDDAKRRLEADNRKYQENLERLVEERTQQWRVSEERARELSRFNQGALDALSAQICVLAEDGVILAVNRAWEAFAGANPPLATTGGVGGNYLEAYSAALGRESATARQIVQGLREVARGDLLEFSLEYPCPALETSQWFVVRATRFAGEGPVRIVVSHIDVTERKKMEMQFLRAQRLEGIGALASGIAHDLNNILAPMLMTTSLLRETTRDVDSLAMLETIESCAQRGADIIKQLLTFARGKPGARIPLPVRHLLSDMVKIIRETFPRDISPNMDASEDLWPLMGDATQVHQALMNLCVNARDAMPDGGTLTVEAKNVTVDEALAGMTVGAKPGPFVCVRVGDTGTGIAPEHLDCIFDPFFTTKEIGKGTGLGLATVLGIVRGHDGFVRVESRLGAGTTFELYFPASPQAVPSRLAEPATLPPRGDGEWILVVDDEAPVRNGVKRTLESHGYRVLTASQGAEGLTTFSQHRAEIRAVLTDMMMPVMSGPALITALKRVEPNLVILGMTGLPERNAIKGLEQLDVALLDKPFSGPELLRTLHGALHSQKAESGSEPGNTAKEL